MKIAVTYKNGEVFQHFGHTEQFAVYECSDNAIISSKIVDTNGAGHGALSGFLKEHGVEKLICGGIGGGAKKALAENTIAIFPGVKGSAEEAVKALLAGTLVYNPNTTCSHHGEDHTCSSEGHHHSDGHSCHH
ncbi:MAG: dinitrogenase iron-molybdenum cofactor biosynthesis protein [Spirochaetaceae bacterium]|nr:dinitrogenase iron-molybdenum cofactor biosynthesis protein [Spirochaetaceae bacterium]